MGWLIDVETPRTAPVRTGDIEISGLVKRFGGVTALDDVSLTIRAGEVHSLVGENGAGKSTLGKVLSGLVTPDGGQVRMGGVPVSFHNPREALEHGVATIAQELALVPYLSVAENVLLGAEPRTSGFVRRKDLRRQFTELAERVGFDLPADAPVGTLKVADQQKVEILRALYRQASLIIMDEPTAALSSHEIDALHAVIRSLAANGQTVLLISHFLSEVLSLSDTITTLRDGRLVRTVPASEATEDSLIEGMLGRSLDGVYPEKRLAAADAPVVLRVDDLRAPGVNGVSLEVRAGEILGIAGLVGAGRSELARAIFRDSKAEAGSVLVDGTPVPSHSPRAALDAGIALIPESRKELGLQFLRSIQDNASLSSLGSMSTGVWVRTSQERDETGAALVDADVRMRGAQLPVGSLSGGNQQKVLFARTLLTKPKVLIADEPTRGVDVGSRRTIYDLLTRLAEQGLALIVISSDLEEVLGLAHRVVVMRGGRIVAELQGEQMNQQAVLTAAFDESMRTAVA